MKRKRLGRLSVLAVALGVTGLIVATAALAGQSGKRYDASLRPVPHSPSADAGSSVTGKSRIFVRNGDHISVGLRARGLTPNVPHAMHIHGKDHPEIARCPGANRRDDEVNDGLIETVEGLDDYGPVQVSLTPRGDTSADSTLALDRFPVAGADGS